MTALGFCVVAALSSHTSGRPFTCSCRMGKSRRMNCGLNGRADTATSGTRSGRNSKDAILSGGAAVAGAPSPPGTNDDIPGTVGTEAASGRAGKLLGGDDGIPGAPGIDCMPGTPGRENTPATSGNDGVTASGAALSKSRKYAEKSSEGNDDPAGTLGAKPGTKPGTLPSDAGIARSSASVSAAPGADAGIPGIPGRGCAPGTPGKENASFSEGNDGEAFSGEVRSRK